MIYVPDQQSVRELLTGISNLRYKNPDSIVARALELELCDIIEESLEKDDLSQVDPIVINWTKTVVCGIRNGRPNDGIMPIIIQDVAST